MSRFEDILASHKQRLDSDELNLEEDAAEALGDRVGRARVAPLHSVQPEHGIAESTLERERVAGEFGGTSSGGSESGGSSENSGAGGGTSGGAVPQRDAPDDDEHRDNTVPQTADADAGTEQDSDSITDDVESVGMVDAAATAALSDRSAGVSPSEEEERQQPEPTHPVKLNRQEGFRTGDGPTVKVGRFPEELAQALRDEITPIVGREFAEDVSNNSLVSGFALVKMGVQPDDVDSNTTAVMRAVAHTEPALDALAQEVTALRETVAINEATSVKMVKLMAELTEVTRSAEYAMSYWFHDRVMGLSLGNSSSVDDAMLEHETAVMATRDRFRFAAKKIHAAQRDRQGRRKQ